MARVVMEPAFPILVTLYNSVMGLVEDENVTKRHIKEWLPPRRLGILKELKIRDLLGRNMILLSIPDMEKPPFFTLFEWAYDLMKGFSPIDPKDEFFDDRTGIPYAQLLLQPACLGLAYIADHQLPIKRCQRDVCDQVFQATNRNQQYCPPCKSVAKKEKNDESRAKGRLDRRYGEYSKLSADLKMYRYFDGEPHHIDKISKSLNRSKASLYQRFSSNKDDCWVCQDIRIQRHSKHEYSFHVEPRN